MNFGRNSAAMCSRTSQLVITSNESSSNGRSPTGTTTSAGSWTLTVITLTGASSPAISCATTADIEDGLASRRGLRRPSTTGAPTCPGCHVVRATKREIVALVELMRTATVERPASGGQAARADGSTGSVDSRIHDARGEVRGHGCGDGRGSGGSVAVRALAPRGPELLRAVRAHRHRDRPADARRPAAQLEGRLRRRWDEPGAADRSAPPILLGPPLVLWGIEAVVGLVLPSVRRYVHAVLAGIVAGLIVYELVTRGTSIDGIARGALVVVGGVLTAAALLRIDIAGRFLRYLAIAPPLFVVLFLMSDQVSPLVFSGHVADADVDIKRPNRVVMVVMDEFPLESLLDGSGHVDPVLFPNFAALAQGSNWYRNATAVSPLTTSAVPALLSGDYPKAPQALQTASNYPHSLFTLLGGTYDINAHEHLEADEPLGRRRRLDRLRVARAALGRAVGPDDQRRDVRPRDPVGDLRAPGPGDEEVHPLDRSRAHARSSTTCTSCCRTPLALPARRADLHEGVEPPRPLGRLVGHLGRGQSSPAWPASATSSSSSTWTTCSASRRQAPAARCLRRHAAGRHRGPRRGFTRQNPHEW